MDNLLRNNKAVLLIALILSILLWITARGTTSSDGVTRSTNVETLTQQVEIQNASDNVTVANPRPTVTITIRGDQLALYKALLYSSSIHCSVDVHDLSAGHYTLPVRITGLPDGVTPDYTPLEVVLLQNVTKDMKVDITPDGNLADGYAVSDIKVDPDKVQLKGPDSSIAKVRKVVANLALSKNDTGTFTRSLNLRAVNDIGQVVDQVKVYPEIVSVTVQITKPTQTLPVKPQVSGDPKDGFVVASVVSSPASVEVLGDTGGIDGYPLRAIDVSGISADKNYTVRLNVIPGVTQVTPSSVTVSVHVIPAQKKTFSNVPILVVGVPVGYNATLSAAKIDVNVQGAPAVISSLKDSDISLSVDVSGIAPSNPPVAVPVPIQVKAPGGVRADLPGGATVSVTLAKTDAGSGVKP